MIPQISNSPEGKLEYLGSHSCREYGPIRTFQDRSIGGLFHPQIPKRVLHFLYRFQGHHILRETVLIGSSFPAVQNNPVYKGVSTLNPQNTMQILQESTVDGDVALFFFFFFYFLPNQINVIAPLPPHSQDNHAGVLFSIFCWNIGDISVYSVGVQSFMIVS